MDIAQYWRVESSVPVQQNDEIRNDDDGVSWLLHRNKRTRNCCSISEYPYVNYPGVQLKIPELEWMTIGGRD